MNKKIGLMLLGTMMCASAGAETVTFPTVKVNNVDHYLADYDERTDKFFDSADGYCVTKGFRWAESSGGAPADVKPVAELDRSGKVVRTLPDTQNQKIWIVQQVTCGK